MSTEPCDLHELIGCTICSGKDRAARQPTPDTHPFVAHYDGECPVCSYAIRAGEDRVILRSYPSGYRTAIHEGCS